jgi:ectoine hydroxylase-related dioxygenase (phytanoyl-CoA dioxygenase family)
MAFLTDLQREHFLSRGFVVLPQALPEALREAWVARGWARLGAAPEDPSTWEKPLVYMPGHTSFDVRETLPDVWAAVCELCGGAGRVQQPFSFGDGFIVNLSNGADRPWSPPGPSSINWHKDGDWFRHFLDSPEQGLLSLVLWTDMVHQGGGTFVACDSVGPVARALAAHPEGIHPRELDPDEWDAPNENGPRFIAGCQDVIEMTGKAGDIVLLHPFVLHASSQNTLRRPRFITNPCVTLTAPMEFDRPDPADFSLVERAVLRGLGVERYAFPRTAPRERYEPPRVALQARMRVQEERRLAEQRENEV